MRKCVNRYAYGFMIKLTVFFICVFEAMVILDLIKGCLQCHISRKWSDRIWLDFLDSLSYWLTCFCFIG